MTDPDAPSPSDPTMREYLHWYVCIYVCMIWHTNKCHAILSISMHIAACADPFFGLMAWITTYKFDLNCVICRRILVNIPGGTDASKGGLLFSYVHACMQPVAYGVDRSVHIYIPFFLLLLRACMHIQDIACCSAVFNCMKHNQNIAHER